MKGHISPARRLAAIAPLLAAVLAIAGCFVDVTLEGSRLSCNADGRCPDGFACVGGRCLSGVDEADGSGVDPGADAGEGEADGAPQDDADPPADGDLPDAPPPDAPVLLSCDEQYGALPGYVLCGEQAGSCTFFLQAKVATSCDDDCQGASGGVCESVQESDETTVCTPQVGKVDCGLARGTKICTCSRVAP